MGTLKLKRPDAFALLERVALTSVGVPARWIPKSVNGTVFDVPSRSQSADGFLLLQKSLFDCVGQQRVGLELVAMDWVGDDAARTVYSRPVSRIVLSLGVLSWPVVWLIEAVSEFRLPGVWAARET